MLLIILSAWLSNRTPIVKHPVQFKKLYYKKILNIFNDTCISKLNFFETYSKAQDII